MENQDAIHETEDRPDQVLEDYIKKVNKRAGNKDPNYNIPVGPVQDLIKLYRIEVGKNLELTTILNQLGNQKVAARVNFSSAWHNYEIEIQDSCIVQMKDAVLRAPSLYPEIWGYLIGYYSKNVAMITKITTGNENKEYKEHIPEGCQMLGEWRAHQCCITPTPGEKWQMSLYASKKEYDLPMPLLIILSSNHLEGWKLLAQAYKMHGELLEVFRFENQSRHGATL